MVDLGIAQLSSSSWAVPPYMVPKSEKELRPCGDSQALNTHTTPDRFPVHHIYMISFKLAHVQQSSHSLKLYVHTTKFQLLQNTYH